MNEEKKECKRCEVVECKHTHYDGINCIYDSNFFLKVVPHGRIEYIVSKINDKGLCDKCDIELKKLKNDEEKK